MQYPEIQFYRGSLVRLATGRLKQVEDLSSDDFLESARLAASAESQQPKSAPPSQPGRATNNICNKNQQIRFDFNQSAARHRLEPGAAGPLDENNNSVFNSPEPTSSFDDSPRMETDEFDDDNDNNDDEVDLELDVVSHDDNDDHHHHHHRRPGQLMLRAHLSATEHNRCSSSQGSNQTKEIEQGPRATSQHEPSVSLRNLKVELNEQTTINSSLSPLSSSSSSKTQHNNTSADEKRLAAAACHDQDQDDQEFYIDSSVVRDFLEVGPIHLPAVTAAHNSHISQHGLQSQQATSPASSTGSLRSRPLQHQLYPASSMSASTSRTSSASLSPSSPPIVISQPASNSSQTVLIKFFLEASRSVAFIEVPIEHPFFVLHRGWSSWNPQRTYDKFGLKCRKLKIGDTCISLIRRRQHNLSHRPNDIQKESDHCNIMFSSIKINE